MHAAACEAYAAKAKRVISQSLCQAKYDLLALPTRRREWRDDFVTNFESGVKFRPVDRPWMEASTQCNYRTDKFMSTDEATVS